MYVCMQSMYLCSNGRWGWCWWRLLSFSLGNWFSFPGIQIHGIGSYQPCLPIWVLFRKCWFLSRNGQLISILQQRIHLFLQTCLRSKCLKSRAARNPRKLTISHNGIRSVRQLSIVVAAAVVVVHSKLGCSAIEAPAPKAWKFSSSFCKSRVSWELSHTRIQRHGLSHIGQLFFLQMMIHDGQAQLGRRVQRSAITWSVGACISISISTHVSIRLNSQQGLRVRRDLTGAPDVSKLPYQLSDHKALIGDVGIWCRRRRHHWTQGWLEVDVLVGWLVPVGIVEAIRWLLWWAIPVCRGGGLDVHGGRERRTPCRHWRCLLKVKWWWDSSI